MLVPAARVYLYTVAVASAGSDGLPSFVRTSGGVTGCCDVIALVAPASLGAARLQRRCVG
jgi:hypothetical protein